LSRNKKLKKWDSNFAKGIDFFPKMLYNIVKPRARGNKKEEKLYEQVL
jgi:hypothetical protein